VLQGSASLTTAEQAADRPDDLPYGRQRDSKFYGQRYARRILALPGGSQILIVMSSAANASFFPSGLKASLGENGTRRWVVEKPS
jgi:hypothetical protein